MWFVEIFFANIIMGYGEEREQKIACKLQTHMLHSHTHLHTYSNTVKAIDGYSQCCNLKSVKFI